jgi:hypothetical protein
VKKTQQSLRRTPAHWATALTYGKRENSPGEH